MIILTAEESNYYISQRWDKDEVVISSRMMGICHV